MVAAKSGLERPAHLVLQRHQAVWDTDARLGSIRTERQQWEPKEERPETSRSAQDQGRPSQIALALGKAMISWHRRGRCVGDAHGRVLDLQPIKLCKLRLAPQKTTPAALACTALMVS